MLSVPIIIEEYVGIDRTNEPVTVGIPFPKGLLKDSSVLGLVDPEDGPIPLQTQVLANWPDHSPKWILLDFQVSVKAKVTKEVELVLREPGNRSNKLCSIKAQEGPQTIKVDTGAATFFINTRIFKPFERVVINGHEIVDGTKNRTVLTGESGTTYDPLIDKIFFETKGPLRSTLKIEGEFRGPDKQSFATFFSRVHFFAGKSITKIEFTILNPRAAKHPGGLWDLGDPGSIFFQDLSIHTTLKTDSTPPTSSCQLYEDPVPMDYQQEPECHELRAKSCELDGQSHLLIYQDSSGGKNWRSRNHVNRHGEVRTSLRGYRVYSDSKTIREGLRANPIVSIGNGDSRISGAVKYFWHNFPKALEAKNSTLTISLFPEHYNDVYELQGGEQKTHTIFLDFTPNVGEKGTLNWIQTPLILRSTPQWYATSNAFPYLIKDSEDMNKELLDLINTAIKGNNTFFHRREIIDEYGWRNFGEVYADHEAVGYKGSEPLISHYNNQYDCVYGALMQYVRTADRRWFLLADQLCSHVGDIDIYHTDEDRPEYNRGLFWHTEHYIDAQTATHRCFSAKHAPNRNLSAYGGGPSLSHVYTTGLLYHYYMTGSPYSMEAFNELTSFVTNNMHIQNTLSYNIIKILKKVNLAKKDTKQINSFVEMNKIYELNGPGRASGNALNTLVDAYQLSQDIIYLKKAEYLVCTCISPYDNVDKRDLLDVENRWMYTIFMQSLYKYMEVKNEYETPDTMTTYVTDTLLKYSNWMVQNEQPYFSNTAKLEYPNETWVLQDLRKVDILVHAAKYGNERLKNLLLNKAQTLYDEIINQLNKHETMTLTRPIVLILQNYFRSSSPKQRPELFSKDSRICFDLRKKGNKDVIISRIIVTILKKMARLFSYSLRKEFDLIISHIVLPFKQI